MTNKYSETGFTLIEVLVSVTLLSIIILTFSNIFVFSNKTANTNNNKIVAVHLAKGTLEKIKLDRDSFFSVPLNNCTKKDEKDRCIYYFEDYYLVNDRYYDLTIKARQNSAELNLDLISIVVEISLKESDIPILSTVEGYVSNE